jgi:hypothetical protein
MLLLSFRIVNINIDTNILSIDPPDESSYKSTKRRHTNSDRNRKADREHNKTASDLSTWSDRQPDAI